jgi:phosphate:Na+ symporter
MLKELRNFAKGRSGLCAVLCYGALIVILFPNNIMGASGTELVGSSNSLKWFPLLMSLFGGLALFLYGMEKMSDGLKSAVGEKMRAILGQFTSNRFKAALTGSLVTAVIQSSSVTTVLVVGFVSSGLMTLSQSVGIIMGANLGTTITAQIVAFKVEKAALALIAVGFILLFQRKYDQWRQLGNILMGLGLVFFGMTIMSDGVNPLRSYQPFLEFMVSMKHPLIGIMTGALFTALVQSSSATTGIVIALASQGLIELPAGISLIFGANIGTCVTALLASIGKSREALRVAIVHVIFNVAGVAVWVGFIPFLIYCVQHISPGASGLEGAARLAADVPRQIANAHTIFNLSNTILLLPFTSVLASLTQRLIKDKPPKSEPLQSRLLDQAALEFPAVSLQNVRMESVRLGERILHMMKSVPAILESSNNKLLKTIEDEDDLVDLHHREIVQYAGRIRKLDLTDQESLEFRKLMTIVDALERIGDVVSNGMVEICRKRLEKNLTSSPKLTEMLVELQALLIRAIESGLETVKTQDVSIARKILEQKTDIENRIEAFLSYQELRFKDVSSDRIAIFRIEMDLVEKQRRIFGLIERMALLVAKPGNGFG